MLMGTVDTGKPAELSWPDYLIWLLQTGAEIEHSLMVQYLYAAYSLGGAQIPEKYRQTVEHWRRNILTVAKEEMGHLITVNNLLQLMGAPLTLDREDYPWTSPFYPYPFKLEPLTLSSLSAYVFAEMPDEVPDKGRRYREFNREDEVRIIAAVKKRVGPGKEAHRVDELYRRILNLIADEVLIPDSAFIGDTFGTQASFDEWGRGYRASTPEPDPPPRGEPNFPSFARYPARVIVDQMASRTQAIAALKDIAGQGEAPNLGDPSEEPSHFDRFIDVYQEFELLQKDMKKHGWLPTHDVPVNPSTVSVGGSKKNRSYIKSASSRTWASLFNLRYRMLLTNLAHTYSLPASGDSSHDGVHPGLLHRTFAEMYNLKTIAGILTASPLTDDPKDTRRAGPPFEMPYTLALPPTQPDCWRLHLALLESAATLCKTLLAGPLTPEGEKYLKALGDIDQQSLAWIDQILRGQGATGSSRT
jgi:hypothetical protein